MIMIDIFNLLIDDDMLSYDIVDAFGTCWRIGSMNAPSYEALSVAGGRCKPDLHIMINNYE